MLFKYKIVDQSGNEREGTIEAVNQDAAISALQRKGYVIASIVSAESTSLFNMELGFMQRVSNKDIVILSRQISTLFEAQVAALRVFTLLASEAENPTLRKALVAVADDLQGGASISNSLAKHPNVFSLFYVNMVRAGEESGRLDQVFAYLADYLDRNYEVNNKAKRALVYPAFVVLTFIVVMVLMLTLVIPRISSIIEDSGQEMPFYTQIVIGLSHFFVNFGPFLFIGLAVGAVFLARWGKTEAGSFYLDGLKVKIPYIGNLYTKLYLSRISDNLSTLLSSGIPMVRALEITSTIVGNVHYEEALKRSIAEIKNGAAVSKAFSSHPQIPGIMVQMIRVGEETGELGKILKTLSTFYQREVVVAVDTLVDLIEPAMIVMLGLGVGVLLAAVLLPIYNITTSIS